jgi:signal transduction histidine kinase
MSTIMERIRRGEKVRHFETKHLRKDGEIIDVSMTISPITGHHGVITGASTVACDITDLKRAQQEHFSKQKLESVGTLAGGIAHDFNNLLCGVLAHSDLALAELASGSSPKEELQRIRAGAIRGAEIVRQLMIYSGQESEALEVVDISAAVEDMLELLKFSISKHATLEALIGKGVPPVRAHPGDLPQVLMNLVINASDAIGDRDGTIRITTKLVSIDQNSPLVNTGSLSDGDYAQLEVSDTGLGMTPDMQARIFDPFFTTKLPGHGLGLAVVQGIVRRLGGAIRVESAPGNGTTLQVLVPCAEKGTQATRCGISCAPEQTIGFEELTILVVEDEDLLRRATVKMLRNKGFSVIEASDGTAAMDLIRTKNEKIDVLLLDITLPGASSREVLDEAQRLRPKMKVIATSAYGKERVTASLAGRVEHFIRKPFGLDQLVSLIRESMSPS